MLPEIILEREQARLGTDLLHDSLHSGLLLLGTGYSIAIWVSSAGPANLGNVLALGRSAGANLGSLLKLLESKVTGLVSGHRRCEVGLHLNGEDVNVVAERGTLLLPGTDGFGGSDSNVFGEAAALKLGADVVDVGGELGGLAVVVEHAFVSDNDHGDIVLGRVVLDVGELGVGVVGEWSLAVGVEVDAVDDLEVVLLACRDNILENAAVGAVGADGSETEVRNLLDIGLDIIGTLAIAVGSVGCVSDSPFVAISDDTSSGGIATSWLRFGSGLAGGCLGCVGWGCL